MRPGSHGRQSEVQRRTGEIGVDDSDGLRCFAGGAGRKGEAAKNYADANAGVLHTLSITTAQEEAIFCALAPDYEKRVQRFLDGRHQGRMLADLDDNQKCMLFDFAYNVGLEKFPKFAAAVLEHDWPTARAESRRGGLEGTRRERETYAFLDQMIAGDTGTRLA